MRLRTACAPRLLLLLSLLGLPVAAQAQFDYTNNSGTITITQYTGPGGPVTIPGTINGLPVTAVGGYYQMNLRFHVPVFVGAFQGSGVTSLTIPSSVTAIAEGAFSGCRSLTAITVDPLDSVYSSVAGVLFDKSETVLNQYPAGKAGSYAIPGSVTNIANSAFSLSTGLTSVTIPDSVTSIEAGAFTSCTGLTSVTIPNSVTSIGALAFANCYGLTNVTIPASLTSIAWEAFSQCTNLKNVTIPDGVTNIEFNAFELCLSLTGVTMGNSVTNVAAGAFAQCGSLTNLTLGNSLISIGEFAFGGCPSLTCVIIPNSVTSIGDYAFYLCGSLASVMIGDGLVSLGDSAFESCTSLTAVYFQGNAPSLGQYVFVDPGVPDPVIDPATIYYLPGTAGWGPTFGGLPTVLWNPQARTSGGSLGVRTNQFGFTVTGSSNLVVVVEATTDLAKPAWSPLRTNTLAGGSAYFSDPQWTNYPCRYYRLRWP